MQPAEITPEDKCELLKKQHLDPNAKKELGTTSGSEVQGWRALKAGFPTVAQHRFATVIGDSKAKTLLNQLLG